MTEDKGLKIELKKEHKKGLIGTACGEVGRYTNFYLRLMSIRHPAHSKLDFGMGLGVTGDKNRFCETTLQGPWDWLFILDDDHIFNPDILFNLLDADVDIICPLNIGRHPPYPPIVLKKYGNGFKKLTWDDLAFKRGVIDVDELGGPGSAPGGAGMLVRRHVLARMAGDWHRAGCAKSNAGGPDLWFMQRARECGFKIHIDLSTVMGHIQPFGVWPVQDDQGEWGTKINALNDIPEQYR